MLVAVFHNTRPLFRSVIERPLATKVLCGWLLLAGARVLYAQTYVVKDLGTLGGSLGSAANAINGSGQVVGYAFTTYGRAKARPSGGTRRGESNLKNLAQLCKENHRVASPAFLCT